MFLGLRVWCGVLAPALLAPALLLTGAPEASAQGRLDARYTIAVTGISVGEAVWKVDVGQDRYTIAASGGASGLLKVLVSGRGEATAQGLIQNGIPVPASYLSKMTSDDEASSVKLTFEDRNVKDLVVVEPPAQPDRVMITDAHRKGVMDPLTALVIPMGGPGDAISDALCKQTLPVFDGRRRFDLRLVYKRVDKVKTERGYQGPVVVCTMTFHPIAGHRPSSTLTKYLSEGRDMELWLAPIAGTSLAAPYRLTIANLIGAMTISPTQWDTVSVAKDRASAVVGPQGTPAPRRTPAQ